MECVPGMQMSQSKEQMTALQCVHSKAVEFFVPSWDDHWIIDDIDATDMSCKVFCNRDIKVQTFLEEGQFLAAVQTDGVVTLLFTVGKKQKFPLCSRINCSNQVKCICYRKYKKHLEEDHTDDSSEYYWDKRSSKKSGLVDHFLESVPIEDYQKRHGYNLTRFEYPIKRCPDMQEKFLQRLDGVYSLPERIIANFDASLVCKHGQGYASDDDKLLIMSPNLTIYTETSDKIFPVPTYGRPTEGDCKCILQADTHNLLLWNMGSGKLIDYLFLHNHIHRWVASGTAMNANFNARKTSLGDIGLESSLTYSLFLRACTGYAQMVQFRKEDFLCPNSDMR